MVDLRRYLALFLSEAREHLQAAYQLADRLSAKAHDPQTIEELLRHVHSMKGMAATLGFASMVSLTHALEDELGRMRGTEAPSDPESSRLLREGLACLGSTLDRIEAGAPDASPQAESLAERIRSGSTVSGVWSIEVQLDAPTAESTEATVALLRRLSGLGRLIGADPPLAAAATGRFTGRLVLRLGSARPRAELERRLAGLPGIARFALARSAGPIERAPAPSRASRWVRVRAELLDDLLGDLLVLRRHLGRLEAEIPVAATAARQRRSRCDFHLRSVYGIVTELRLVPFDFVAHRLHQTVHELATKQGKPVDLRIGGGSIRLDRGTLDALIEPLMHIVKNGIDHGIEPPDERRRRGKPARALLRLELERRADRVQIRVEDDGRGMDPRRLRRRAVELGLLEPDRAEVLDDASSLLLATAPGFTIRRRPGHVSGRGVGLDVVDDALRKLGGTLSIRSRPGRGCTFVLSLPPGQALIPSLLVRAAGELYALPIESVERTVDVDRLHAAVESARIELVFLRERLGLGDAAADRVRADRALFLAGAPDGAALVVDEVLGRQDLVVRPLRGALAHLRHLSGAALTPDGTIALLLDPTGLVA